MPSRQAIYAAKKRKERGPVPLGRPRRDPAIGAKIRAMRAKGATWAEAGRAVGLSASAALRAAASESCTPEAC